MAQRPLSHPSLTVLSDKGQGPSHSAASTGEVGAGAGAGSSVSSDDTSWRRMCLMSSIIHHNNGNANKTGRGVGLGGVWEGVNIIKTHYMKLKRTNNNLKEKL